MIHKVRLKRLCIMASGVPLGLCTGAVTRTGQRKSPRIKQNRAISKTGNAERGTENENRERGITGTFRLVTPTPRKFPTRVHAF